jgi:hypothetical protein
MKLYWRFKKAGKWTWTAAQAKRVEKGVWAVLSPAWAEEEE